MMSRYALLAVSQISGCGLHNPRVLSVSQLGVTFIGQRWGGGWGWRGRDKGQFKKYVNK